MTLSQTEHCQLASKIATICYPSFKSDTLEFGSHVDFQSCLLRSIFHSQVSANLKPSLWKVMCLSVQFNLVNKMLTSLNNCKNVNEQKCKCLDLGQETNRVKISGLLRYNKLRSDLFERPEKTELRCEPIKRPTSISMRQKYLVEQILHLIVENSSTLVVDSTPDTVFTSQIIPLIKLRSYRSGSR